jgi:hypothetical protein
VTYIVFELAPCILCEAGRSPLEVARVMNCLHMIVGYACYDGPWTATRSSNKYAKTEARGSDFAKEADRTSFDSWANGVVYMANGVVGFTDLI